MEVRERDKRNQRKETETGTVKETGGREERRAGIME